MVRNYIEKRGGTEQQPEHRWRAFEELLASPRMRAIYAKIASQCVIA